MDLWYYWTMGRKQFTREKPKFGVSLGTISRKTGLRPYHVSRILNGKGVTAANAYFVAQAMGITIEEFMRRFYPNRVGVAA